MTGIPVSVAPPKRFSSPGMEKLLVRLSLASAEVLGEISQVPGNAKILSALHRTIGHEEHDILQRIADDLSIELIEFSEEGVSALSDIADVLDQLERDLLLQNRCIPVRRDNGQIVVAMADPLDRESVSELEFVLQTGLTVAIASEARIVQAISELHVADEIEEALGLNEESAIAVEVNRDTELELSGIGGERSLEQGSQAKPVVRLVNKVLGEAVSSGASDIHFEPAIDSLEIRVRVDGIMLPKLKVPKRLQAYVTTRIKILAGMDITIRQRPQDGRFRMRTVGDTNTDIRVSSVPTPFGEKLVLRLLCADACALNLELLGMPRELEESFRSVLNGRERVVLAAGPTGSGKTTTLYSALMYLKDNSRNIVTVEDPIEFRIPGTTQIQVDTKVGMTFASGLRSILRQDPDIILVGEIRDLETAEIAAQAAQTGHLVLSTLHANTAPGAVVRLQDLGLEPFVIASSLGAVMAQRLVRKVCPKCARALTPEEVQKIKDHCDLVCDKMCLGEGCEHCSQTGYRGRVGVYSLLVVNQAVREAIRNGAGEEELSRLGQEYGAQSIPEAAVSLLESGATTFAEVDRVIGLNELIEARVKAKKGGRAGAASSVKGNGADAKMASISELAKKASDDPASVNILLIDDDEGIRMVMTHSLKKAGFSVSTAKDGAEGLEQVRSFRPDIIICDIIMPGMDGRVFLDRLKSDGAISDIPILMLTASDNESNEIDLISAGADDFVSKTASPALVIARIKRLIERQL